VICAVPVLVLSFFLPHRQRGAEAPAGDAGLGAPAAQN
jgi:hypothetical protein